MAANLPFRFLKHISRKTDSGSYPQHSKVSNSTVSVVGDFFIFPLVFDAIFLIEFVFYIPWERN